MEICAIIDDTDTKITKNHSTCKSRDHRYICRCMNKATNSYLKQGVGAAVACKKAGSAYKTKLVK